MSSMIKTQKAVKSTKTEMTAEEKKRKQAILAQYSQVCDGEYPFNNNRTLQLKTGSCSAQSGSQIVNNNNYKYQLSETVFPSSRIPLLVVIMIFFLHSSRSLDKPDSLSIVQFNDTFDVIYPSCSWSVTNSHHNVVFPNYFLFA